MLPPPPARHSQAIHTDRVTIKLTTEKGSTIARTEPQTKATTARIQSFVPVPSIANIAPSIDAAATGKCAFEYARRKGIDSGIEISLVSTPCRRRGSHPNPEPKSTRRKANHVVRRSGNTRSKSRYARKNIPVEARNLAPWKTMMRSDPIHDASLPRSM